MKLKSLDEKKYKEWHIKVHKDLDKEFEEMRSKYNNFGIDNATKTEIVRMLITNLIVEFSSDPNAEYKLHKKLTEYRGLAL